MSDAIDELPQLEAELLESKKQAQKRAQMQSPRQTEALPATTGECQVFLWHGRGNEDVVRLCDAMMRTPALAMALVNIDGRLHWIAEGRAIALSKNTLSDVISRHFAVPRVTVSSDGIWQCSLHPLSVDAQAILDVMQALLLRCMKASAVMSLSDSRRGEIISRLRMNEPLAAIARAYNVDVEAVEHIKRTMPRLW